MLKDDDPVKPWELEPARTEMSSILWIMKLGYGVKAIARKVMDDFRIILRHGRASL